MDLDLIKKINLAESLSEAQPHIKELSEEEIAAWDGDQIRAHYSAGMASEAGKQFSEHGKHDKVQVTLHPRSYSLGLEGHRPSLLTTCRLLQVRQTQVNVEEAYHKRQSIGHLRRRHLL